MKFLLSWLIEHIKIERKEIDILSLVEQLNATTAEIDEVKHIHLDVDSLFAAKIIKQTEHEIQVDCSELKKTVVVPGRKEILESGSTFLIKREQGSFRLASLADIGSEKEGMLPSLWIDEDAKGAWRSSIEPEEHVLVIDNKALTNRPDLWGHRGFAREIAALLDKSLINEEQFLASKTIKHYEHSAPASGNNPYAFEIKQDQLCGQPCRRLAGLYIPKVDHKPSLIKMAVRLARVDVRPLNALVDMTNYVMYDLGQPMHVFDASRLSVKKIEGRCADEGEKMVLLDGDTVTLSSSDYIIADGERPIAVAGIMGGKDSSVQRGTSEIVIESANFDPAVIRRTSTRLKKRTDASTRFEKSLDPNQNTLALLRYLQLLEDAQIHFQASDSIVSLGALAHEGIIEVSHALIESKIGAKVSSEKIEQILTKLGFGVDIKSPSSTTTTSMTTSLMYVITVPTFRATKDITIAEDIIEEVARFIGYDTIPLLLPSRLMEAFDTSVIMRLRAIKQLLAYGLCMREVSTYAFFNEEFLRTIEYDPADALVIANPQSEHWKRLITSLIPNLLQSISVNAHKESLRFFECNRVWFFEEKPIETQECAGIWYESKQQIDFYEGKAQIMRLFDLLRMPIRWEKQKIAEPWYDAHLSATLYYKDRIIGSAGMMAQPFLHRVATGSAFIFELDAQVLLHEPLEKIEFKQLHRFPATDLDISLFVPRDCSVAMLEQVIRDADKRIISVELIDLFEKPEWDGKKSATFRFIAYDDAGTLSKEGIDAIWDNVVRNVASIGAQIR